MEDFSQLCHVLQSEYNARSIPFSLRDYVRMCLESIADLISEDRPEQFHSAMARFFAALYGGNELFNRLPVPSRNNLNSVTIGIPPRRLFELLNDFARVINELSLLEMSSETVRSSLQENGFPYRPNEFFSLLEQFERLDLSFIKPKRTTGKVSVDVPRLAFFENQERESPGITIPEVTSRWNKKHHQNVDVSAFTNSLSRARKKKNDTP